MNLKLLDAAPNFDTVCILTVDALAPLSMVTKAPGKYYLSQAGPSDGMLYGLLENALGLHVENNERLKMLRWMQKQYGVAPQFSEVGYASLLQFHLKIAMRFLPEVVYYQDLWSQHLKGASFAGGSREYDGRAIPIMNAQAAGDITFNDRADAIKDETAFSDFQQGQSIHLNVIRPYFPQYYISPTPREYVEMDAPYRFRILTSTIIADEIARAITDPAAPLYLGSNDGWVDAALEVLR